MAFVQCDTEDATDPGPEFRLDLGFVGTRLGYNLHRTDLLHMRLIGGMLAEIGLTPARATALSFVKGNPGCAQAQLGRALDINRASTMELVNALTGIGALERQSGPDRRSQSLQLTAKGERLYARFRAISIEVDTIIMSRMHSDDVQKLASLLASVHHAIENHISERGN